MLGKYAQFSLKILFLFLTIVCIGSRVGSRIVDLRQKADAEHRQSEEFLALTRRLLPEDRANRRYCFDRAFYHLAVATEYDWAVFNPWVSVQEPAPPPAPPDVLRMLKQA